MAAVSELRGVRACVELPSRRDHAYMGCAVLRMRYAKGYSVPGRDRHDAPVCLNGRGSDKPDRALFMMSDKFNGARSMHRIEHIKLYRRCLD